MRNDSFFDHKGHCNTETLNQINTNSDEAAEVITLSLVLLYWVVLEGKLSAELSARHLSLLWL